MRDTARWCFLERGSVLSAFGSSVEAGRDEQRGAEKVKSLPILLARIRVASLPSPPSHCCRCTTVNRPKNNNKTVMTSLILYIYIFFFPQCRMMAPQPQWGFMSLLFISSTPPPSPAWIPSLGGQSIRASQFPRFRLCYLRLGKGKEIKWHLSQS